jgi:putative hydrolase of the HAD superfamily
VPDRPADTVARVRCRAVRRVEQSPHMNIVFDLGAVVIDWEPARLLQAHFPEHAPDTDAARVLARAFFHHPDWQDFDRGVRDVDDVVERTAARLSLPRDRLHDFVAPLGEHLMPIDASVDLLSTLRDRRSAGEAIRLHYLSNMPVPYARALERRFSFFQWFDGGIFSGDVKLIKPDGDIYEMLAWRHGLEPSRTLFIDDMPANVEAARAQGWHAIHCTSPTTLSTHVLRQLDAAGAGSDASPVA